MHARKGPPTSTVSRAWGIMKIVQFTAENIKKLTVVQLRPDGTLVEITGPNGSGKSSVLDAIFYALRGTAGIPPKVVRKGEESAYVELDLGEIVVTRRFTAAGGTSLFVESQSGARFPSPQRMLDDLVGALSFDPLAFTRMKPAEQLEALRRVVKLDVDIDALDAQTKAHYAARTERHREIKSLEAQVAALPGYPDDTPEEPLDVAQRMQALTAAGESNTHREKLLAEQERRRQGIALYRSQAASKQKQALEALAEAEERCTAIMEQANKRHDLFMQEAKNLEAEAAKNWEVPPIPEAVDTAELQAQANEAIDINRAVAVRKQTHKLKEELRARRAAADTLTGDIDANQKLRAEAIARAAMPVPGLSFGDGEVLLNELPLGNASDADQLRLSVAIAMAANPKLRVLRIRDGSLLDQHSLKALEEMASAEDYQVWIERIEAGGKVSVVMEDGHVAKKT